MAMEEKEDTWNTFNNKVFIKRNSGPTWNIALGSSCHIVSQLKAKHNCFKKTQKTGLRNVKIAKAKNSQGAMTKATLL